MTDTTIAAQPAIDRDHALRLFWEMLRVAGWRRNRRNCIA